MADHGTRNPTKEEQDRHHTMVTTMPKDSDHAKSHHWPHKAETSTHFHDGSPVAATPTPQEHTELMKKNGHQPRPDPTDPAVQQAVVDRLKKEKPAHEPKAPPQHGQP